MWPLHDCDNCLRANMRRATALHARGWIGDAVFALRDVDAALALEPGFAEAQLLRPEVLASLAQLEVRAAASHQGFGRNRAPDSGGRTQAAGTGGPAATWKLCQLATVQQSDVRGRTLVVLDRHRSCRPMQRWPQHVKIKQSLAPLQTQKCHINLHSILGHGGQDPGLISLLITLFVLAAQAALEAAEQCMEAHPELSEDIARGVLPCLFQRPAAPKHLSLLPLPPEELAAFSHFQSLSRLGLLPHSRFDRSSIRRAVFAHIEDRMEERARDSGEHAATARMLVRDSFDGYTSVLHPFRWSTYLTMVSLVRYFA